MTRLTLGPVDVVLSEFAFEAYAEISGVVAGTAKAKLKIYANDGD